MEPDLRLTVLLADLADRTAEIRQRTDHEQKSYLTYFTSLLTAFVAVTAADKFGDLLSRDLRAYLPALLLALAVFLLWLPLDAINEQLRIRLSAVYIHTHIRPQIIEAVGEDEATLRLLTWETFQSSRTFRLGLASPFVSAMFVIRAGLGYAPSVVVLLYYFLGVSPFATDGLATLETTLLVGWGVIASIPLAISMLLATQKRYRTGV